MGVMEILLWITERKEQLAGEERTPEPYELFSYLTRTKHYELRAGQIF
jgi:hypothetical protein